MEERVIKIEESISKIKDKENVIYFLTYDTKDNARAAVKHVYDMCLTLKNDGYNAKILVEDSTYTGVEGWLGEKYNSLEVVNIKEGKIEIKVEDVIVIPEYYSNILPQLTNVKATKVMLVQQQEYIFETLAIGSRWEDFGVERAITTNEVTKKKINELFPSVMVNKIVPIIGNNFKPTETPLKPYIAIHCRDRVKNKKIISEFYLKYPQLRWISFRDMVQLSYEEFSDTLKECVCSLWIDDISTYGTFPLESMKCHVPVIGKIPEIEPEWMGENSLWVYDENKVVETLSSYVLTWINGGELDEEVYLKMDETIEKYTNKEDDNNIVPVFEAINNKRVEVLNNALTKLTEK